MFKQACSVVKEAIDADNTKDYRKAFNLYQKSLTYFAHVIKCKLSRQREALHANAHVSQSSGIHKQRLPSK